jgi:hypothetical protein
LSRERQRHRYEDHEVESLEVDHQQEVVTTTGDDMMYRTSVAVIPIEAMMQAIRRVSSESETMLHHHNSYSMNRISSFCLPCSDPNSVIVPPPLPFLLGGDVGGLK